MGGRTSPGTAAPALRLDRPHALLDDEIPARVVGSLDGSTFPDWARIRELADHGDIVTTARTYSHVVADERELDYAEVLVGLRVKPEESGDYGVAPCGRWEPVNPSIVRSVR